MGHNIEYYDYPATTDSKKIEAKLAAYVEQACIQEGGHLSKIRWCKTYRPYESREAAEQAIRKLDRGWYDCIAVLYKDLSSVAPTSKIKTLRQTKSAAYKKLNDTNNLFHFADAKSEYIGCKNCGSKIARKYLKTNYCPVCHADMRPASVLTRIATLQTKVDKIEKELETEEARLAEKSNVRWLVKIEYHQ